jgi:hypothetical protein
MTYAQKFGRKAHNLSDFDTRGLDQMGMTWV